MLEHECEMVCGDNGIYSLLELGVVVYESLSNLQKAIFNIEFNKIYKGNDSWNEVNSVSSCCTSMMALYSYVNITDPKLSSEYDELISFINESGEDKFTNLRVIDPCKLILVDIPAVIDYMLLYVEISNGVKLESVITEEDNSERVIEILRTLRVLDDIAHYLTDIEYDVSIN